MVEKRNNSHRSTRVLLKENIMSNAGKDFDKYAYFRSRARNYGICMTSERRANVDGEVVIKAPGFRIEFNNHLKRIEKTEMNEPVIKFLRDRMLLEKDLAQNKRMLFEETKADILIPEKDVKELLSKKNEEIASLKEDNATVISKEVEKQVEKIKKELLKADIPTTKTAKEKKAEEAKE